MIVFEKLRYKNFLSTGDNFTEIDLTNTSSTLVVGQNGAGKSTMLDALSFALFGKAHRNVNKPQLINSVNNKDCEVQIEFIALGNSYKIIRGLKPNRFEIWQSGTMINQDSHAKEYQKILEQNILKLNHKSFHQIVVLGSSSFIPFMQLSATNRRDVIEDLLDINVFSKMNGLLKEKTSILKDDLLHNDSRLEIVKTRISSLQSHIAELEKISDTAKREKESELVESQSELARLESLLDESIAKQFAELEAELDKVGKKKSELEKYQFQFDSKIKKFTKDVAFYEDNDQCPTCDQEITSDTKDRKISESIKSREQIEAAGTALQEQLDSLKEVIDDVQTRYLETNTHVTNQETYRERIGSVKNKIQTLHGDITRCEEGSSSVHAAKSDLESEKDSRDTLSTKRLSLLEEREYNSVIAELLKDTGIKTKIIKQYLPVINQLTNQYLQVLDFYVSFDLDETFTETIRSRHRDAFSYDSFSEGEKQRIDLALLFTWRQVAKMKNSVATNLLVLDETFDSSLDADGVENLLKILDTLDNDTNVFIISHKGELLDNKFDRKIEFVKHKNFSKIA
jgi:DNA repair exonuclease SbcCD ATPase subunit